MGSAIPLGIAMTSSVFNQPACHSPMPSGRPSSYIKSQRVSPAFFKLSSLAHLGSERVGQFMGEEPSGRGYDEIALDANGQPHNPMINRWRSKITLSEAFDSYSGAILSASMLLYMVQPELSTSEKFEFVQNYFQRMAGGMPVGFQNTVREDLETCFQL